MKMACFLSSVVVALLVGCSEQPAEPAKLSDKEKEVVAIARKAVAQFDDWADRAEFKIKRGRTEWHVTAWRVEHPNETGNKRYVPWGRREIVIDDAGKVVSYANSK
jgi:outer membrane biogenesis lipoprotein LolB